MPRVRLLPRVTLRRGRGRRRHAVDRGSRPGGRRGAGDARRRPDRRRRVRGGDRRRRTRAPPRPAPTGSKPSRRSSAASPSVTYQLDRPSDPYWDPTDPQETSAVRDVWSRTRGRGPDRRSPRQRGGRRHAPRPRRGGRARDRDRSAAPGRELARHRCGGRIVAARAENGIGGAGMAPAARIMPIRVCNDSGCPSAAIVRGIFWAADHGADVINMSLVGAGLLDVTAVASATRWTRTSPSWRRQATTATPATGSGYPAANSGVIAVSSATAPDGAPATGRSTTGQVDIAPSGTSDLLTMPGGAYGSGSGTSFSDPPSPVRSPCCAAPSRASRPSRSRRRCWPVRDSSAGWDRLWGAGRLHVPSAFAAADRADGWA